MLKRIGTYLETDSLFRRITLRCRFKSHQKISTHKHFQRHFMQNAVCPDFRLSFHQHSQLDDFLVQKFPNTSNYLVSHHVYRIVVTIK